MRGISSVPTDGMVTAHVLVRGVPEEDEEEEDDDQKHQDDEVEENDAGEGLLVYIFLLGFNLFSGINGGSSWNLRAELLEAPFEIWFVGSVLGFFVIMLLWRVDRLARVVIEEARTTPKSR